MGTPKKLLITRHSLCSPLFGLPKELSGTILPTYEDLLLSCFEKGYKLLLLLDSKKKLHFQQYLIVLLHK